MEFYNFGWLSHHGIWAHILWVCVEYMRVVELRVAR